MARKLGFWKRFAVCVVKPATNLLTKADRRGWENIPDGGVILAVNHISHSDPFIIARYIYDSGRWPRFLAKESLFRLPVGGMILRATHQIPVRRGSVDASKALDAAVDAVKEGGTVVIYPEGTTTKEPQLWPMRGKTGAARLALLTGAPVIPVAMWGPEKIFDPRNHKLRLRLRPRTPIWVWAGRQVDLSKWEGSEPTTTVLNDMTETIMLRIRDLVSEIRGETAPPLWTPAATRKEPTE
jgi:1-acyl-sn-glycerol-3-phosphate acyltransferase